MLFVSVNFDESSLLVELPQKPQSGQLEAELHQEY
jgi:hypothetical protein